MNVPVDCPHCGSTISISNERYAAAKGKNAKCKKCEKSFVVKRAAQPQEEPVFDLVASAPIHYATPAPVKQVYDAPPSEKRSNGLGIAATVLGLMAMITAFVPFCGIFGAATFGILGGILGLVGLFSAISDKRTSVAFPLAGISLCIVAGLLSLVSTAYFASETNKQMQATSNAVAQQHTLDSPVVANQTKATPQAQTTVLNAGDDIGQFGDVKVTLLSYGVGKIDLTNLGDDTQSKDELFWVKVRINNLSTTKKFDYKTWRGASFSIERDFVSAKDNFGNILKRIDFGIMAEVKGAVKTSESIYPNKGVDDMLIFEQPVDGTTVVTIELPPQNIVGKTGDNVVFDLALKGK